MTDDPLLSNVSFEGDCGLRQFWWVGGDDHKAATAQGPYKAGISANWPGQDMPPYDNIEAPKNWVVWWIENVQNPQTPFADQLTRRPEAHLFNLDAGDTDTARVRTGRKSFKIFTFNGTQRCGLVSRVSVPMKATLRLTAYVHGWYSDCSSRPHGAPYMDDCNTLASDSHMLLRVGISPSASFDPLATGDVQWSDAMEQYGGYGDPMVMDATASGSWVTIWLESSTNFALKHEDVYWDDVTLEVTSTPSPRLYDRTAILYGPDTTKERAHELLDEFWDQRRSFLFSADDAMAGNEFCLSRTVYAYDGDSWPGGKQGLVDFKNTYYPGVDLIFEDDNSNPNPPPSGELLWQCDPAWRNYVFGIKANGCTLCRVGCYVTCLAMAQRLFGLDADATPVSVDETLGESSYVAPCLPLWTAIENKLQIDIGSGDTIMAKEYLDDGYCCMAEVQPTSLEHFVLVTKYEGNRFWMLDPYKNVEGWLDEYYAGVESWRLLMPVEEPTPPPTEFNPRVLTLHLQQDVESSQRYVSTCKPAGIKRVLGAQNLPTYAVLNPGMRCVYRGMDENENPYTFIDMHIDTLHQVADMFADRGLPLIDGKYFWFELWNEVYGWDRPPNVVWRDREIAAINYLAQKEPRVGAVAFNAGVGNIPVPDFDILVPLARAIRDNNGMFGLHSYFGATPTSCTIDNYEDEGRWLESRWEMIDDYLLGNNIKVNWFLSEGGAIYYEPPTNMPSSAAGYKYIKCMNGDWSRYLDKLEQLVQHYYQENLKRGGRLKGYAIFTQGGWDTWRYFELGSEEVDDIAAMQVRLWPI